MMWRDVVELISIVTESQDEYGDPIDDVTSYNVFANKKSIRQSEFYQAHAFGLKPEIMFEVRTMEYLEQPKLVHNGKTYQVIRTYSKNNEITELICAGLSNSVPEF